MTRLIYSILKLFSQLIWTNKKEPRNIKHKINKKKEPMFNTRYELNTNPNGWNTLGAQSTVIVVTK